jgi:hypothetical protein
MIMKQTLEEAAIDFADYELRNLDKLSFVVNAKADYDNGLTRGFKAGADWQSKQSPWISVEDRLPGIGDIVLTKGTYGFLICHLSPFGEWKTESHVNKKKLGITHFMYIPLL